MSASVEQLEARLLDGADTLTDIIPSAITLAMMLRHRNLAAWLRSEFDGYPDSDKVPDYRRQCPGHIVARSPQYGWIAAPISEEQKAEFGHLDLTDGIKALESACQGLKKGSSQRVTLEPEQMAALKAGLKLNADLAISLSRQTYSELLRTVRGALLLWARDLRAKGIAGEHTHYEKDERQTVAALDTPDHYWQQAWHQLDALGVPDVREVGLLGRFFGKAV
ncbi:AbiTii domain-containing protein [Marinobacter sp. C2H3]|uniref:AbiTii domain-containing protein n=1 Tax=Marinobacter sp. C2H3 TaxID=3119003 RepID=UPI00300F48A4